MDKEPDKDEEEEEDDSELYNPVFGPQIDSPIPEKEEACEGDINDLQVVNLLRDEGSARNKTETQDRTANCTSTAARVGNESLSNWNLIGSNSDRLHLLKEQQSAYEESLTYTLNGSQIMSVITEKDLGVHVCTKLSWNNRIDVTISKANKMLGMIKRTCTNEYDQKTLIILYKSLVRSQLEYASQVWSPFTKEKITALERVQRRATKFILKTDLCYPERLVKLRLIPLEYRREILDLCFSLNA